MYDREKFRGRLSKLITKDRESDVKIQKLLAENKALKLRVSDLEADVYNLEYANQYPDG